VRPSSPAGEINGIATLAHDVRELTGLLAARWGTATIAFDRAVYLALLAKARRGQLRRLTSNDSRQLVTGVVGDVGNAIIVARQLAQIGVFDEAGRATYHARQAAVIGPARLMWDAMGELFRNVTRETGAASGLGNPVAIAAVITGGVAWAIFAVAAVTALTYLVDSQLRLAQARREVESFCRRSGGCTAEQYSRLRRELAVGPFDGAIRAAGEGIGEAVTITLIAGGAVIAGIAVWGGWKIWQARKAVML
jgi:hypothetical protein